MWFISVEKCKLFTVAYSSSATSRPSGTRSTAADTRHRANRALSIDRSRAALVAHCIAERLAFVSSILARFVCFSWKLRKHQCRSKTTQTQIPSHLCRSSMAADHRTALTMNSFRSYRVLCCGCAIFGVFLQPLRNLSCFAARVSLIFDTHTNRRSPKPVWWFDVAEQGNM